VCPLNFISCGCVLWTSYLAGVFFELHFLLMCPLNLIFCGCVLWTSFLVGAFVDIKFVKKLVCLACIYFNYLRWQNTGISVHISASHFTYQCLVNSDMEIHYLLLWNKFIGEAHHQWWCAVITPQVCTTSRTSRMNWREQLGEWSTVTTSYQVWSLSACVYSLKSSTLSTRVLSRGGRTEREDEEQREAGSLPWLTKTLVNTTKKRNHLENQCEVEIYRPLQSTKACETLLLRPFGRSNKPFLQACNPPACAFEEH